MSDFLFDRRVRVIVASLVEGDYNAVSAQTLTVSDLRVQFKVEQTLEKGPNKAEIQITNLSETTRSSLQAKGAKVILQAGYQNTIGQVFKGDIRTIDHQREGPDWVTKIEAGDGERAYLHARVGDSFAGGVKLPDVIKVAAKKAGYDITGIDGKLGALDGNVFENGYVMHGRASKELDKLLTAVGYEWSVQDGRLQILAPGEANTEKIVTLSSDTGLIGSPTHGSSEHKKKPALLKFKALLSPELRPGGRVNFESAKYHGVYRIKKIRHTGDTAGGEWYSEGEAEVVKK